MVDQAIIVFLQALRDVLPQLREQSDERLTKRIGKEKLEEAALDLEGFMNAGVNNPLTQNERLALASKLLRLLSQYIQEIGNPVTINTVITHMSLIAHATNNAFPGYAESKLLRYAVTPFKQETVYA